MKYIICDRCGKSMKFLFGEYMTYSKPACVDDINFCKDCDELFEYGFLRGGKNNEVQSKD